MERHPVFKAIKLYIVKISILNFPGGPVVKNTPAYNWLEVAKVGIIPNSRGKTFGLLPPNMLLAVRFSYTAFIIVSFLLFLVHYMFLLWKDVEFFSSSFIASIEMIWVFFFSFILLRWHITLINFCPLTHSQIPGISPTWL